MKPVSNIPSRFIFAFINSGYSFWWDVVKDWDFTLFSPNRLDREHPYGLRRHRNFSSDRLYHYVIIADLALRFSWLWRVVPGLTWLSETESGLFILMFLEVARRWMWVFFRVEAEWSKFHLFHSFCSEPFARRKSPEHHGPGFLVSFADHLSFVQQFGTPKVPAQTMFCLATSTTSSTRIKQRPPRHPVRRGNKSLHSFFSF
jgi:hypothetical protein